VGLYAIVDLPHPAKLDPEVVTRAVLGDRLLGGSRGAAMVQLRAKSATTAERIQWLDAMAPLCERAGVPLVVNDDVEAALGAAHPVGVHLGQDDPGASDVLGLRARAAVAGRFSLVIGLSTHNVEQVRKAVRQGPDYIAMGPVLPTASKAAPDPVVGFDGLLAGCRTANVPLVAIGGLSLETGRTAIECGAHHVAVIGALVAGDETSIRERALVLHDGFADAARLLSLDDVYQLIPVLSRAQLLEIARWSDDIGLHIEMGLPARFRPPRSGGEIAYRRCDVMDLLYSLDKRPDETWDQWGQRTAGESNVAPLVRLRQKSRSS